ncbi:MAG: hypothetical protein IJY50_03950 [Clostridia bacterium]|nr:hypothetical protein [Clostridia bacterium]
MRKQRIRDSYIVRFFAFLTDFIYNMLSAGFLGRVFTAYATSDRVFRSSQAGRLGRTTEHGGGKMHRALRRHIALAMNQSCLINGVSALIKGLCRCSMRTLGLFFMTAGFYSSLVYWLLTVIWDLGGVQIISLFGGAAALILGVLLLFSEESLGYVLSKGIFFNKILVGVFGVSDDALRDVEEKGVQSYAVAIPCGMVIGALLTLISPLYVLGAALAIILVLLVLSVPEAGVVLLILLLPFAGFIPGSAGWITLAAVLPLAGYFGKLLRGNRAFHMEVQDLPVLLIMLLFLLCGFSVAGSLAWQGALMSMLLTGLYFLTINVIATPRWFNRCRIALIVSATAASLLGVLQFILAALAQVAPSLPTTGAAVHAGFVDRISFAYFLVLAFPFALSAFASAEKKYRLFAGFALITIVAAVVFTWVQSALVALVAMLIAFLLLYERKSFPYILVGGILTPITVYVLPDNARSGLLTALRADSGAALTRNAVSSDLAGRIFFEAGRGLFGRVAGVSRLIFGLGYGGIEQFCALYTSASPAGVSGSMNFWLYRLLEGGILGVILPAVLFFLVYQNCFSLMKSAGEGRSFTALTGVVLITGVLIFSIFRYAWYDPAALSMFFMAVALIGADARYQRSRMPEKALQSESQAQIEYTM